MFVSYIRHNSEYWCLICLFSYLLFCIQPELSNSTSHRIDNNNWEMLEKLFDKSLDLQLTGNKLRRNVENIIYRLCGITFFCKSDCNDCGAFRIFFKVLHKISVSTELINDDILMRNSSRSKRENLIENWKIKLLKLSCESYQSFVKNDQSDDGRGSIGRFSYLLEILLEKMKVVNPNDSNQYSILRILMKSVENIFANVQVKYNYTSHTIGDDAFTTKRLKNYLKNKIIDLFSIYKDRPSVSNGILVCLMSCEVNKILNDTEFFRTQLKTLFSTSFNREKDVEKGNSNSQSDQVALSLIYVFSFPPIMDNNNNNSTNSKFIEEISFVCNAMTEIDLFSVTTLCLLIKRLASTHPISFEEKCDFLISFPTKLFQWVVIIISSTLEKFYEDKSFITTTYLYNFSINYFYKWKNIYDEINGNSNLPSNVKEILKKNHFEFMEVIENFKKITETVVRKIFLAFTKSSFKQRDGIFKIVKTSLKNFIEQNASLFLHDVLDCISLLTLIDFKFNIFSLMPTNIFNLIESTKVESSVDGSNQICTTLYHFIFLTNFVSKNNKASLLAYDEIIILVCTRLLLINKVRHDLLSRNDINSFITAVNTLMVNNMSQNERNNTPLKKYTKIVFKNLKFSENVNNHEMLYRFLHSLIESQKLSLFNQVNVLHVLMDGIVTAFLE